MNRSLALIAAVVVSAIFVSSACMASPSRSMAFTLQASQNPGNVQLSLNRADVPGHSAMSSSFAVGDLPGLDLAALVKPGQHPLRFAYVRDAGRVDCTGSGGNSVASGRCGFTQNA